MVVSCKTKHNCKPLDYLILRAEKMLQFQKEISLSETHKMELNQFLGFICNYIELYNQHMMMNLNLHL